MGRIGLSSQTVGAEETRNILSGIKVKTAPVHVGNSNHVEMMEDDAINLTLGVFFDGTGNNRENTESRKLYEEKIKPKGRELSDEELKKADKYRKWNIWATPMDLAKNGDFKKKRTGSYENDLSNVARLEKFYEDTDKGKNYFEKIYIEGIGTTNGKDDDIPGGATGMSALWKFYNTGIRDKVKKGCEKCMDAVTNTNKKEINNLTIDVFGFSRGAAAARHFLHEIHKKKGEHKKYVVSVGTTARIKISSEKYKADGGFLGELLVENNIRVKNATIRFAGLFDSVASHGLSQRNDVKDLGLDAVKHAQHTFHLAAADEHRFKFSLTDISSAGSRGVEKFLPGVHSDVGGCYEDDKPEEDILLNFATFTDASQKTFEKDYEYLIEQGWYKKKELKILEEIFDLSTFLGINDDSYKFLWGNRKSISNRYSYIPLQFMGKQLLNKNVFDTAALETLKKDFDFSGDTVLVAAEKRLRNYVFEGGERLDFYGNAEDRQILLSLRNKYFHFSSDYFSIGMMPEWKGSKRARTIYSDSGQAPKAVPLHYNHPKMTKEYIERIQEKSRRKKIENYSKAKDGIPSVPKITIPKVIRSGK